MPFRVRVSSGSCFTRLLLPPPIFRPRCQLRPQAGKLGRQWHAVPKESGCNSLIAWHFGAIAVIAASTLTPTPTQSPRRSCDEEPQATMTGTSTTARQQLHDLLHPTTTHCSHSLTLSPHTCMMTDPSILWRRPSCSLYHDHRASCGDHHRVAACHFHVLVASAAAAAAFTLRLAGPSHNATAPAARHSDSLSQKLRLGCRHRLHAADRALHSAASASDAMHHE